MKIVPYMIPDKKNPEYAIERLGLKSFENIPYYEIKTHYKGEGDISSKSYSIAFRIEDPSPYLQEDLTLHLNRSSNQNTRNPNLDALTYDAQKDLWSLNSDNRDGSGDKAASGVFGIIVKYKGRILEHERQPLIYVLPSSIGVKEYLTMLKDLFRLHENLVLNRTNAPGIGEISSIMRYLENERNLFTQLHDAIQAVMSIPSELLGKRYVKIKTQKIRRFDGRVLRDYVRHGQSGRITGIEYFEDHNTYENRVILSVLRKLNDILPVMSANIANIQLGDGKKSHQPSEGNEADIDSEEEVFFKESIRTFQEKLSPLITVQNGRNEAKQKLLGLLNDQWFDGITVLPGFLKSNFKNTLKFTLNARYNKVYELITQLYELHPILNMTFDINAFGVESTNNVYEIWVFYKLLSKLIDMGFTPESEDQDDMRHYFLEYLESGRTLKDRCIRVKLINTTSSLRVEAGFNVKIGENRKKSPKHNPLQPDCYLQIHHNNIYHWYFLDAKYWPYSKTKTTDSKSYIQEIYDIAISKYLYEMSEILKRLPGHENDKIGGSYIVMSKSDDENSALAENGRLFGGQKGIFDEPSLQESKNETQKHEIRDDWGGLPQHRYGAIVLTPEHDGELRSLLQMIFEYLESDQSDDADKNNRSDDADKNPNLLQCWRYGNKVQREISQKGLRRGIIKYYVKCPECGAFRVDNHCAFCKSLIIKHTEGNYHSWDSSVASPWVFICPNCGAGMNRD